MWMRPLYRIDTASARLPNLPLSSCRWQTDTIVRLRNGAECCYSGHSRDFTMCLTLREDFQLHIFSAFWCWHVPYPSSSHLQQLNGIVWPSKIALTGFIVRLWCAHLNSQLQFFQNSSRPKKYLAIRSLLVWIVSAISVQAAKSWRQYRQVSKA